MHADRSAGGGRAVSRRGFLKYCIGLAGVLGLPLSAAARIADALANGRRQPVVWLSFQECTGCTESLTRSHAPTFETLIFDFYSLDYHHTLQAASGEAAEAAREEALRTGDCVLIVDGAVPLAHGGACSTIAGRSNLDILAEAAVPARLVIAVGSCAAFGGLPVAAPNPTAAVSVEDLMVQGAIAQRPLVNLPGCPPLPEAIAATLAHFIAFDRLPMLDPLHRPLAIYGNTVHDRCPRVHFFQQGLFAESFDDEGARQGWCLYRLGCRGPVTHNACATMKWNEGTSSPIDAGHPCIGCSEPGFWDAGPMYQPIAPTADADRALSNAVRRGQQLFDEGCVYCHEPAAGGFRSSLSALPEAYATKGGRAHRVTLEPEQWADLLQYLKETP